MWKAWLHLESCFNVYLEIIKAKDGLPGAFTPVT